MNSKNLKSAGVILLLICFVVSLYYNRENYLYKGRVEESNRLRDSMIDAQMIEKGRLVAFHVNRADSLENYTKAYVKADSINIYNIQHEKAKIRFFTPEQRKHVLDSILGSATH